MTRVTRNLHPQHIQIRGTGEIIERIVSREEQRAINRQATEGDGRAFQARNLASLLQQQQQPPRR